MLKPCNYFMPIIFCCSIVFSGFFLSGCHVKHHPNQGKKSSKLAQKSSGNNKAKVKTKTAPTDTVSNAKLLPTYNISEPNIILTTQILLYLSGYEPGNADGILKEQTKDALATYKKVTRLTQTTDTLQPALRKLGLPNWDTLEISDLQQVLLDKNFDPGPLDNIVGGSTRTAYHQFCRRFGFNYALGFSPQIKQALFSRDSLYTNFNADALYNNAPPNASITLTDSLLLSNVSLKSVKLALLVHGYDPGPIDDSEGSKPYKNALFKFQVANNLPLGSIDEDTLRALGFR